MENKLPVVDVAQEFRNLMFIDELREVYNQGQSFRRLMFWFRVTVILQLFLFLYSFLRLLGG